MRARVLICAGLLAVFGVHLGSAPGAAQTTTPPANATLGFDALDRAVYQPRAFLASPGLWVKRIDWASWSTTAAGGSGRFRVPKGAVVGLKKKSITVKLKFSQPKQCQVYDSAGNPVGTVNVFAELFLKSVGRPGKCAVICSTEYVSC